MRGMRGKSIIFIFILENSIDPTYRNQYNRILFYALFTFTLKMPNFKCSLCKQDKDEGEYDSDRRGMLRKSCRACLVDYSLSKTIWEVNQKGKILINIQLRRAESRHRRAEVRREQGLPVVVV